MFKEEFINNDQRDAYIEGGCFNSICCLERRDQFFKSVYWTKIKENKDEVMKEDTEIKQTKKEIVRNEEEIVRNKEEMVRNKEEIKREWLEKHS